MEIRKSSKSFNNILGYYLSRIDAPLFMTTVAVLFVSILNLYGIGGAHSQFFVRQCLFVGAGILAMVLISLFNYRYLKNYSFTILLFYGISVLLLAAVFLSSSIRGSHAWIILGGFTFEPSEVAKVVFIVVMAKYFSQRHIHINQFRHIIISGLYLALPLGLILLQPDLGSATLLVIVWGGMLLAAGMNKRQIFLLVILGVLVSYSGWVFALKPYQRDRLLSFTNPNFDPTGIGYNVIQSRVAIGSGSWLGRGLGQGTQSRLGFLPESHNDFAFAALGEQFGFAGLTAFMGLIMFLVVRIMRVGERARGNFEKLFCVGLVILILSHVIINAAVNVGLFPITGIPFSFLSYGGSHLIALMVGLGLVQSIKRYSYA